MIHKYIGIITVDYWVTLARNKNMTNTMLPNSARNDFDCNNFSIPTKLPYILERGLKCYIMSNKVSRVTTINNVNNVICISYVEN